MIRMAFVGDVSLGEHYFSFGHGPRTAIENGQDLFSDVKARLSDCDLACCNLEGPISDIGYDPGNPHKRVFRGPRQAAAQLKDAGFTIVNVANNHFVQHGIDAAVESVQLLQEQGITVIGQSASPVQYIQVKGQNIALIGCSLIKDNTDINQSFYFAPSEPELIRTAKAATAIADLTVVFIHWGIESELGHSRQQRELAMNLLEVGVKIIVGHHPHTLQPLLFSPEHLVAYSLGNFVFDLPWCPKNTESGLLKIEATPEKINTIAFHQYKILKNGKPVDLGKTIAIKQGENLLTEVASNLKPNYAARKLLFFIGNIFNGATLTKLRFIAWKLKITKK